MGAGDFPAGDGPAGYDPIGEPGEARPSAPPRAVMFDGATRTFPQDATTGRLIEVHPVDQEVELAVLVELGKVASSPSTGSTLKQVTIDDQAKMEADVDRRLREAVKRPLDAGDIAIHSIEVTSRVRWRLSIVFRYKNLRLPPDSAVRTLTS